MALREQSIPLQVSRSRGQPPGCSACFPPPGSLSLPISHPNHLPTACIPFVDLTLSPVQASSRSPFSNQGPVVDKLRGSVKHWESCGLHHFPTSVRFTSSSSLSALPSPNARRSLFAAILPLLSPSRATRSNL
ncbi:hypothetical protein BJY01DRAFT_139366 [Aspergillus pseudoustus]|uniref:Uncharacterized protein n=1 Tax=Aspergillus pseudoustus TaxID=1810923 RepID=A0ABR4IHR8_9EURO